MSKKEKFIFRCLALFGLGVAMRWTGALSPIHELGHIFMAWLQGSGVRISDWNAVNISRITPIVLLAGHYFEMFVYAAVTIFLGKRTTYLASFAHGAFHANIFFALRSTDFLDTLPKTDKMIDIGSIKALWVISNLAIITVGWRQLLKDIWRMARSIKAMEYKKKRSFTSTSIQKPASITDTPKVHPARGARSTSLHSSSAKPLRRL